MNSALSKHSDQFRLAVLAALALSLGTLVYVLDRPPSSVYFLPRAWSGYTGVHHFGSLGGQLPDFAHTFAFSLLTAAVLGARERLAAICIFWAVLDSLFKLAEHPGISPHVVNAVPRWFEHVPVLENTRSYFLHGTFDPLDLIAIALGSALAFLTARFVLKREN